MKISVDGGGLCAASINRFGNYTFSFNLIKALSLFDKNNQYFVYTFCQKKQDWPKAVNLHYQKFVPRFFWMKLRVSWQEIIYRKDIFLALNQAVPLFGTKRIISFCHGLSYYFYPQLYSAKDLLRLKNQLKEMIKKSDKIIVSSKKVKDEFVSINRLIKTKIIVLPFGIPFDMKSSSVLFKSKPRTDKKKFFLFVGMNHPIKNVDYLIKVFLQFIKEKRFSYFQLYLIGDFKQYENINKNIVVINRCDRLQLKQYYQKATAYLTTSFYESFNLPVLEALSQGCPVIGLSSAIIPEFRPYVNIVKNKKEFVDKMKEMSKNEIKSVETKKIKKIFSWKNYVNKLVKLY